MTKVFIGGSRRIARLPAMVRVRLDRIMERGFIVLVGDANGADRAVQSYLSSHSYARVEVFCSEGRCRNNLGGWEVRTVPAPKRARGFEFYTAKDIQMTRECTVGFMIWDGDSRGTEANVVRLLHAGKKVVVFAQPMKGFVTLKSLQQWEALRHQSDPSMHDEPGNEAKRFEADLRLF